MSDYNVLVLPVLDHDDHLIGVLTIDDILEATIPPNGAAGATEDRANQAWLGAEDTDHGKLAS